MKNILKSTVLSLLGVDTPYPLPEDDKHRVSYLKFPLKVEAFKYSKVIQ